jgi:nucleoside-triphosphatase
MGIDLAKRLLLLTGNPGVGKTTVLLKVVEGLRVEGYRVGGMISREVRSSGIRVGFEILDLESSARGWLAHVDQKIGPRVGRYGVNLVDLDNLGVGAILKAVDSCDAVAIDEVGPMELFSKKFEEAVRKAVESGKLVISIVHWKARSKLIDEMKTREDAEVFAVTAENRDNLHTIVAEKALRFLRRGLRGCVKTRRIYKQ